MHISEKKGLCNTLLTLLVLLPTLAGLFIYSSLWRNKENSIKVGILYATSGPNASLEQQIVDSLLLAIEEINAKGGVLGRTLEPVIEDTMSEQTRYKEGAEKLIIKENVSVVFGCLNSGSRKLVKPVIEHYKNMLVYPGIYEGLEQSPNILYTGMIPNQFVFPGILWCFNNVGKTFYLANTNSLFSTVVNELAKLYIQHLGGTIIGESTVPLNEKNLETLLADIEEKKPSCVINTLETTSNMVYFKTLTEKNLSQQFPTIAFNLYEDELTIIGINNLAGHYTAWSYHSNLNTERNRTFKYNLSKKFGARKMTGDLVEAAYTSVHVWAKAVQIAQSTQPADITKILSEISFNAPGGLVYFDNVTNHVWRTSKVGRITNDGNYNIVWNSQKALEPIIYPFNTIEHWETFLEKLIP